APEAEHGTHAGRRLNHVELLYRPGEREPAKRVFELLGFRVVDRGGTFFTAFVEPGESDFANNAVYASEVTEEQWALEQALAASLESDDPVGVAARAYLGRLRKEPQRSFHFGVRYPSIEALDATIARIGAVGETDPELVGRIGVSGVFRPGDPGSYTDTMVQAFARTDVVAAGVLAFGQHVELQYQIPAG
ncbi:MAG TPA: hypothetical protein VFC99_17180, partial [Acidimicrobiia bacterium]|nr:hypothetical protein [Acidimicrobiia bacterium]